MTNPYTPYYLKFASEAEADLLLAEVGFCHLRDESTPEEALTPYYSVASTPSAPGDIDIVGEIYNDDGVYSEPDPTTGEVAVVSPPTLKEGWHVNLVLAGPLPEPLEPYMVSPATPSRKFGGF